MHFKGYEDFVSRVLDLEEKAKRYQRCIFTPFLNSKELEIVHQVVKDCFVYEDGGYEDAELKRAAITYYEEDIIFPIVCLKASFNEKYYHLSHRDVLGAIMNLGIERNVIGDIFIQDSSIFVIVEEEMESFFISSLTQIGRCGVNFERYDQQIEKEVNIVYSDATISSFRLDSVVSAMAHLSREKAKVLIKSGRVKVNQVVLEECDYLCNNSNAISIRGYGRFLLVDKGKKTKKDRYLVKIGKYI